MPEKKTSLTAMKSTYRKMKERRQKKESHEIDANYIPKEAESDHVSAKSVPRYHDFEKMFEAIIERDFAGYEKKQYRLRRFGGKEKLRELLFPSEEILTMGFGTKDDEGMLTQLISDDVLVITDKRLLYIQSKALGTLVHEFSLNEAHISWSSYGSKMTIASLGKSLTIYINKESSGKIKEVLHRLNVT